MFLGDICVGHDNCWWLFENRLNSSPKRLDNIGSAFSALNNRGLKMRSGKNFERYLNWSSLHHSLSWEQIEVENKYFNTKNTKITYFGLKSWSRNIFVHICAALPLWWSRGCPSFRSQSPAQCSELKTYNQWTRLWRVHGTHRNVLHKKETNQEPQRSRTGEW